MHSVQEVHGEQDTVDLFVSDNELSRTSPPIESLSARKIIMNDELPIKLARVTRFHAASTVWHPANKENLKPGAASARD